MLQFFDLFIKSEHIYLLLPLTHAQIADISNQLLHMSLFECFYVNIALSTLGGNDTLNLQGLSCAQVCDKLAHQQETSPFFFSHTTLYHPKVGVSG